MGLVETREARGRSVGRDELEIRVSGQLVGIIDILLGLTLVEGALSFKELFNQGADAPFVAYVAVALVYYTAVRSFIDWHIAMEVRPYRVLTKDTRNCERTRVLLDFLIMASYSFLLLQVHSLVHHPASNLTSVAITYAALYSAYIVWGNLRENARAVEDLKPVEFGKGLLRRSFIVALLLLALYQIGREHDWLGSEALNAVFLLSELALMVWYRRKNWSQQVTLRDEEPQAAVSSGSL